MMVVIIFGVALSEGAMSSNVEETDVVVGTVVLGVSEMISSVETGVLDASAEVM